MSGRLFVTAAVEGLPDEAALRVICRSLGVGIGDVFGRTGKSFILKQISGYNNSAKYRHWIVLVDLDSDYPCPGIAVQQWLSDPAALMCFRVAVRELEAWLLADARSLAEFLGIRQELVPTDPDALADPKRELLNLARQSRVRAIREDMVPNVAAGQSVGPAYTSRLIEFISRSWRPDVAAERSPSLRRCIAALQALVARPYPATLE